MESKKSVYTGTSENDLSEEEEQRNHEGLRELELREKQKKENNIKIAKKLIELAGTENGLSGLRDLYELDEESGELKEINQEKTDIYYMFVNTCLVHMIPKNMWNRNHMNKPLSELTSVADEAMAMLVLENICCDLNRPIKEVKLVNRKTSQARYTKNGKDSQGKMRGWHYNGVKRYNKLVIEVLVSRRKNMFKEKLDEEMKRRYVKEMDEAAEVDLGLADAYNQDMENGLLEDAYDLCEGMPTIPV